MQVRKREPLPEFLCQLFGKQSQCLLPVVPRSLFSSSCPTIILPASRQVDRSPVFTCDATRLLALTRRSLISPIMGFRLISSSIGSPDLIFPTLFPHKPIYCLLIFYHTFCGEQHLRAGVVSISGPVASFSPYRARTKTHSLPFMSSVRQTWRD